MSFPNNVESCQSSPCQNSFFSLVTIPGPKYIFGKSSGFFKIRSRYVNGEIENAFLVDAYVDGVLCTLRGISCLRTLAKGNLSRHFRIWRIFVVMSSVLYSGCLRIFARSSYAEVATKN